MAQIEVYRDDRYVLGQENGLPFISIDGKKYTLTGHPYEPCLYITDESGARTVVHNAFLPSEILYLFSRGKRLQAITGKEYDALDFCRMVEYAAGKHDIQIDEAERGSLKRMIKSDPLPRAEKIPTREKCPRPECDSIIGNDPFFDVIADYPDSVIDWCLVKNEHIACGYNAHWCALVSACRKLFFDDEDEAILRYDAGKAQGRRMRAENLFASADHDDKLTYRKAFLEPPFTNDYTDADFDRINAALFPEGTDRLEVFEWSTDWSEYFDEGHEWWGALCLTVFDRELDRFAVIMASATD